MMTTMRVTSFRWVLRYIVGFRWGLGRLQVWDPTIRHCHVIPPIRTDPHIPRSASYGAPVSHHPQQYPHPAHAYPNANQWAYPTPQQPTAAQPHPSLPPHPPYPEYAAQNVYSNSAPHHYDPSAPPPPPPYHGMVDPNNPNTMAGVDPNNNNMPHPPPPPAMEMEYNEWGMKRDGGAAVPEAFHQKDDDEDMIEVRNETEENGAQGGEMDSYDPMNPNMAVSTGVSFLFVQCASSFWSSV